MSKKCWFCAKFNKKEQFCKFEVVEEKNSIGSYNHTSLCLHEHEFIPTASSIGAATLAFMVKSGIPLQQIAEHFEVKEVHIKSLLTIGSYDYEGNLT